MQTSSQLILVNRRSFLVTSILLTLIGHKSAAATLNLFESCDDDQIGQFLADPYDPHWFRQCAQNGKLERSKCPGRNQVFSDIFKACVSEGESSASGSNERLKETAGSDKRTLLRQQAPFACPFSLMPAPPLPTLATSVFSQGSPNTACSMQLNNCPPGYNCILTPAGPSLQSHCCGGLNGFSNQAACPNGHFRLLDPGTGIPQTCHPTAGIPCPPTYLCVASADPATGSIRHSCCGRNTPIAPSLPVFAPPSANPVTLAASCPVNYAPLVEPNGAVRICNPHTGVTCPRYHLCVSSVTYAVIGTGSVQYLCCGRQAVRQFTVPADCPNGLPAISLCSNTVCPLGSQCLAGACCTIIPTDNCPGGFVSIMGQCKRLICSLSD